MLVTQVHLSGQIERFEVTAGTSSFIIEGNRPFLRGKGLKHKQITWKPITIYNNRAAVEELCKWIEAHIKSVEQP